jgi:hypothetical protein
MGSASSPRMVAAAAAFLLALGAALFVPSPEPGAGPRLTIEAVPVPLDPGQPDRDRIGPLVYRGGLWLRSPDPRFGGLSDLRVSPDGRQLRAVSDCGRGFGAELVYDAAGRLSGLDRARLVDLVGLDGRPLVDGRRDAESLVARGAGLEVGFEGTDAILRYAADPPFGGPARRVPAPAGLRGCGENGGIETMTIVDERRLLVCETRRGPAPDVPAWLGNETGWVERRYPLVFEGGWAGEPFRPTAAAPLPDGGVLVLERRFPPIGARIVRLTRRDLGRTGALRPREIARIEAPLTRDNFEGIDVRRRDAGCLVYLLSDDNGCAKRPGAFVLRRQRTLLLMFALEG